MNWNQLKDVKYIDAFTFSVQYTKCDNSGIILKSNSGNKVNGDNKIHSLYFMDADNCNKINFNTQSFLWIQL